MHLLDGRLMLSLFFKSDLGRFGLDCLLGRPESGDAQEKGQQQDLAADNIRRVLSDLLAVTDLDDARGKQVRVRTFKYGDTVYISDVECAGRWFMQCLKMSLTAHR